MIKKIWALDHLIDTKPLEDLNFKICIGISKSKSTPSVRLIPHYEMSNDWKALVDFKNSETSRIKAVADESIPGLSDYQLNEYNKLSYVEKRKFLELYCNGYHDGDFIRIRFTKQEYLSDSFATFYSEKTEESLNYKNFPELTSWINTLPFIDIGRILIFVTNQYMNSDVHFDRRDDWLDGKNHFLWFNPFGKKKFFLIEGYEKEYVDSKCAFFNTSFLHGSDMCSQTTYTLRIDG
jgi:hypothetical protein